jgi:hypothetical protein
MRLISIHVQVPVVILFVALDFQLNLLVVIHDPLNYQLICFLLLFPRQNHRVILAVRHRLDSAFLVFTRFPFNVCVFT